MYGEVVNWNYKLGELKNEKEPTEPTPRNWQTMIATELNFQNLKQISWGAN